MPRAHVSYFPVTGFRLHRMWYVVPGVSFAQPQHSELSIKIYPNIRILRYFIVYTVHSGSSYGGGSCSREEPAPLETTQGKSKASQPPTLQEAARPTHASREWKYHIFSYSNLFPTLEKKNQLYLDPRMFLAMYFLHAVHTFSKLQCPYSWLNSPDTEQNEYNPIWKYKDSLYITNNTQTAVTFPARVVQHNCPTKPETKAPHTESQQTSRFRCLLSASSSS